jgi:hypothetical protein
MMGKGKERGKEDKALVPLRAVYTRRRWLVGMHESDSMSMSMVT